MRFLKTYKAGIKDLPFLLLVIDLIWYVLSYFNLYSSQYWWIPELTGHSLAFVLFMAFYAYVHKYCLYSWVCIAGLGLLNLLNLLHYFVNFEYHILYAGGIIIPCIIFAIIKWKQRNCYKVF